MEKYINKNTIVEDNCYNTFKNLIICKICQDILIKPVMCMKCQKVFCKRCIDEWNKNNKKCPDGCDEPNYQNCLGKNEILSKLKFKCTKCEEEINYDDAKKHHDACCPNKNLTPKNISDKKKNSKRKIERLKNEKVNSSKKEEKDDLSLTGKKIIFL